MAILNADRGRTAGISLKTMCPLQHTSYFSVLPFLDDGIKSSIATLAKSLTSNFLLYDILF